MEKLSDVARRLGATLHGSDAEFTRVNTDTRQLRAGDLFVALKGERFDGHDFVLRAASLGAVGCIVSRKNDSPCAQIVVPDTLTALQDYAASWRKDAGVPVIAVTGSNGKTTTKQLLAEVAAARGSVLATEGNLNNHIGVPLTLLRLRAEQHRTAIIEMGANHLGEIARLAAIARPDVGIVTMAGDAHLEGFGSREGVARGKGELFAALDGGVAIINADDAFAPLWQSLAARASILTFGLAYSADVRAERVQLAADETHFRLVTPEGHAEVTLRLAGRHNVGNALAAAAGGVALGISVDAVAAALSRTQPVAGRLNWKKARKGARVLDDTYNANPSSLRAAMELLATLPGQRWLVLGDMKELGADAEALHEDAGRVARQLGVDRVYAVGDLARAAAAGFGKGRHFNSVEALVDALYEDVQPDVAILVKGSRSSRMERVVAALCGTAIGDAH
jgi:UDP-N-acetylmuramoyl-tripeptide--D-alanyl-D-alanine ligase